MFVTGTRKASLLWEWSKFFIKFSPHWTLISPENACLDSNSLGVDKKLQLLDAWWRLFCFELIRACSNFILITTVSFPVIPVPRGTIRRTMQRAKGRRTLKKIEQAPWFGTLNCFESNCWRGLLGQRGNPGLICTDDVRLQEPHVPTQRIPNSSAKLATNRDMTVILSHKNHISHAGNRHTLPCTLPADPTKPWFLRRLIAWTGFFC